MHVLHKRENIITFARLHDRAFSSCPAVGFPRPVCRVGLTPREVFDVLLMDARGVPGAKVPGSRRGAGMYDV